jgi:hypothetical protein
LGFVPLFDNFDFGSTYADQTAPPPPPGPDPAAMSMAEQIGELRGELNQLRQQEQFPPQQMGLMPPANDTTAQPAEPATVIVLRNGQQLETKNYAVMDQTLWNFSAKPLQKIPLSSINIPASEKANADRGVDFSAVANSGN